MDSVTIIRIVAGVLFVVILGVLLLGVRVHHEVLVGDVHAVDVAVADVPAVALLVDVVPKRLLGG